MEDKWKYAVQGFYSLFEKSHEHLSSGNLVVFSHEEDISTPKFYVGKIVEFPDNSVETWVNIHVFGFLKSSLFKKVKNRKYQPLWVKKDTSIVCSDKKPSSSYYPLITSCQLKEIITVNFKLTRLRTLPVSVLTKISHSPLTTCIL